MTPPLPSENRRRRPWLLGCGPFVAVPLIGLGILGVYVINEMLYWRAFQDTYDWQQRMGGNSSPINVAGGKDFPKADFDCTELNDAELAELVRRMPSLQELRVNGTLITDGGLVALERLSQLKKLEIAGTQVTTEAVARLREKYRGLQIWSNDEVKREKWGNRQLKRVADLGGATSVYIDTVPPLSLSDCRLGDDDLQIIFENPAWFARVCLRNTNVADENLRHLQGPLAVINLAGTVIGDSGLKNLPRELQVLILRGTRVTDAGLRNIEGNLVHLDLRDTAVTDAGIGQLTCVSLRLLRLKGSRVSGTGVRKLRAALPMATIEF